MDLVHFLPQPLLCDLGAHTGHHAPRSSQVVQGGCSNSSQCLSSVFVLMPSIPSIEICTYSSSPTGRFTNTRIAGDHIITRPTMGWPYNCSLLVSYCTPTFSELRPYSPSAVCAAGIRPIWQEYLHLVGPNRLGCSEYHCWLCTNFPWTSFGPPLIVCDRSRSPPNQTTSA